MLLTSTENLCPFSEDLPAIFKVQIHVRSGLAKNKRDKNKSFVSTPSVSERVALSGTVTIKLHYFQTELGLDESVWKSLGRKILPVSNTGYFRGNRLNWGCSISTSNACQEMFGSLRVLVTDTN